MNIVYVISDHGFGHAGRSSALILELLRDGHWVHVVSSVPKQFFIEFLHSADVHAAADELAAAEGLTADRFVHIDFKTDVGLVQRMGIEVDVDATVRELEQFWSGLDRFIDQLQASLEAVHPPVTTVLFDVSPLGPMLAQRLQVPSVVISNFDWVDIFEAFPDLAPYVDRLRAAYRSSDRALYLPWKCAMSSFAQHKHQQQLGLFGRQSQLSRADARRLLQIPDKFRNIMLVSFGGHAGTLTADQLASRWPSTNKYHRDEWLVITAVPKGLPVDSGNGDSSVFRDVGSATREYSLSSLTKHRSLSIVSLVAAANVLVTKPGYGFVSEAILHNTAVLYVRRDEFQEQQFLIDALPYKQEVTEQDLLDNPDVVFDKATQVLQTLESNAPPERPTPSGNKETCQILKDWFS